MTDAQLIEAAAKRYGLTDPSPDDLLSQRWPAYNHDQVHTTGYHRMYDLVMARVGAGAPPKCACGTTLKGASSIKNGECSICRRADTYRKYVSQPLTGEDAKEVVRLYVHGKHGIDLIAGLIGRSPDRVRATLKAKRVKIRGCRSPKTNGIHVSGRAA